MINADDMQSWAYLLAPTFQFVNTAGKPLTEGWLEVYIAGTRNKYYCASDFNGTLHPFQIPLDSLGANIVLADPSQAYDVYAYNKFGSLIMSRYHVTPVGAGGSSSVLNIVISSEDGTVTVNSDGNGNFDLSIQDTVDRVEALEDAISHINDNITVGYAIGHANTVNLDNTINLVNDGVSGIDYLQDMTGYRLKPGHVYQFNYNAKFECGEHDQYCSGKFYIEGADTVAQEWLFNLDDSYYHSECFNGSTVLVTPNDLAYYDIQLKYAWDVDYANKPDIDLNKISIVDITSIINSTGEGGGTYTAGDGIVINDTTNVISVDMNYINSHLDIDATEIIASAVNIATAYTNTVSGDIINYIDSVSGNLVDLISDVTGTIPEQVNADWNAVSGKAEILNKPDLSVYATHSEVSAVSGNLVNYVNSVSGDLVETITSVSSIIEGDIVSAVQAVTSLIPTDYVTHNEVSGVSGNIINYVNNVSGDIVNYVDESIVSAIDVISGIIPEAQVQSNWTETDDTDPSYIQNKPIGVELVAGQNIGIFSDDTTITIAASATDLSDYATHNEVSAVSSVLENDIQTVSAALSEQIPNITIQSPSGTLVINETVSGNNKLYSIDVAANSGIEYGQFYATNITNAATMSRTKGNIDVTNDGKIKLKKGQSYHVTVRGRYNQTTISDDYGYVYYIEYITNNSIIVNVDKSRSGSQYFELSYDLYKLNNDTDYYVYFTLDNAKVNDLFIEIHSLANVGGNSSGGGSSTEYDAGYGIQILNNVISVSGIYPQVNSDWNSTSGVSQILNKPVELEIVAGQNIGIFSDSNTITIAASGADLSDYTTHTEVSAIASAYASGGNYTAGSGINIVNDTISVDTTIIPTVSAVSAMIDAASANGNLFIATYNVTTWQEALNAYNSGKYIVCKYDTQYEHYYYSLYRASLSINTMYFGYIDGTNKELATLSSIGTGRWNKYTYSLQSDWNETNTGRPSYIQNKPDLSVYTTQAQVSAIASAYASGGGGSGINYQAGDHIAITGTTISVTGIGNVIAGSNISIAASGENIVISSAGGQQVQANWDEWDSSSPSYIQNKPNIPQDPVQSDWNETDPYSLAYIQNKPNITDAYTGASGIAIDNSVISLDEPLGIVAGSGINIVIEGDSAIICVSGVTGGGGSGTNYQEGYGIDITNDTISVDTTVIPTVSAVQAMISAASGSNNLFIATYNSTSRQDLIDAYNAGKYIVCKADTSTSNNDYEFAPLVKYKETNQGFYFVRVPWETTSSNKLRGLYGITIYWNASDVSYANKWNAHSYSLISNWNETDTQSINYIQNKPDLSVYTTSTQVSAIVEAATASIPTPVQVNSDWKATSGVAEILNKPNEISLVAGSGINIAKVSDELIISSTATGSLVQVNSDWNATSGVAEILNKPIEANLLAGSGISFAASGSDVVINTTPIELVSALPANPVSGVLYLIPEA